VNGLHLHSLTTRLFLWFWGMLLLMLAAVIILPTLDPRNLSTLPESEQQQQQFVVDILSRLAEHSLELNLPAMLQEAGPLSIKDIYIRDNENTIQSTSKPDKEIMRFMLDSDDPTSPKMRHNDSRLLAGPFALEHRGKTYYIYLSRQLESHSLFLALLDHPIRILTTAMLVSTPLCLLMAWRLSRPTLALQKAVSRIAAGELNTVIPHMQRRDEVGSLAASISHMVETLRSMIIEQKRLLSDISHELRSPLTRMQLAQSLIRRKQGPSPELERIAHDIAKLDTLIGDLLTLSRVQQHNEPPQYYPLADVLEPILEDAGFEAGERGKQLFYPSLPSLSIEMWPDLLARAIENPLRNALKYADQQVTLAWRKDDRVWVLEIVDDGPGVPSELLDKLFFPFFRVDNARNAQTGGTGLGLAIATEAIARHGGTISAHNQAPHGLRIVIRLPLSRRFSSLA
jgi:two-component system sensor histidine kinase CpxA